MKFAEYLERVLSRTTKALESESIQSIPQDLQLLGSTQVLRDLLERAHVFNLGEGEVPRDPRSDEPVNFSDHFVDLERCAVKNVWKEMLGRPMSEQEQLMYMDGLTSRWMSKGRSFKQLMKLIIDTDAYRRID